MKKHRQRLKCERGQGLVEAALTIPLFLLILCGILDFGWIYSNQLMLNNCSREAARFAVVSDSKAANFNTLVTQKAKDAVLIGDPADVTVTVSTAGSDVTVRVERTLNVLTPVVGIFTGQQVLLNSNSTMRMG